jgi:hypothetical protein
MGKSLFSVLLCLNSWVSFGQVFPQGNAEWISVYQSYSCPSAFSYHLWDEKLTGDTTIGSLTYQTLTYQPLCIKQFKGKLCQPYLEHSTVPPIDIGGIREDGQKVFFYKFDVSDSIFTDYDFIVSSLEANNETLLYDFNWSTGDTVSVYVENGVAYRTYQVTTVDTIDGKKHITLKTLFAFGHDITVIEGYGESRGIFGMYYFFNPTHDDLLYSCFYQDNELLENHPQCETCGIVSTKDQPSVSDINLFPNPASDELFIDVGDISQPFILQVFSSSGQLIYKDPAYFGDYSIPIFKLGLHGWIFIALTDPKGFSRTGKAFVSGY